MPLPSNNPHTPSNAATGKPGQRQKRASLTRQLFRQTMIAAARSAVMKKGSRATANKSKPVLVRGRLQVCKTSMIFQVALALTLGATGQGAIAIGSYSIDGRTDSNNWFIEDETLIVDINDKGARAAGANPINDYRSILVCESDFGPMYFRSLS